MQLLPIASLPILEWTKKQVYTLTKSGGYKDILCNFQTSFFIRNSLLVQFSLILYYIHLFLHPVLPPLDAPCISMFLLGVTSVPSKGFCRERPCSLPRYTHHLTCPFNIFYDIMTMLSPQIGNVSFYGFFSLHCSIIIVFN